jgi:hypothetical protein
MRRRRHLELEGTAEIARIVEQMNRRKASTSLRILRDCTPAASAGGEETVRSPWRHGEADRNDRPAAAVRRL